MRKLCVYVVFSWFLFFVCFLLIFQFSFPDSAGARWWNGNAMKRIFTPFHVSCFYVLSKLYAVSYVFCLHTHTYQCWLQSPKVNWLTRLLSTPKLNHVKHLSSDFKLQHEFHFYWVSKNMENSYQSPSIDFGSFFSRFNKKFFPLFSTYMYTISFPICKINLFLSFPIIFSFRSLKKILYVHYINEEKRFLFTSFHFLCFPPKLSFLLMHYIFYLSNVVLVFFFSAALCAR